MKRRHLTSTRRVVPAEKLAEYAAAWSAMVKSAEAADAHAWRFASVEIADLYLEFLEYGQPPDVRDAAEQLEMVMPAERSEEWEEVWR